MNAQYKKLVFVLSRTLQKIKGKFADKVEIINGNPDNVIHEKAHQKNKILVNNPSHHNLRNINL
jgi:hypothetical protein